MIEEFKSVNELYDRVKPALRVKISEAKRNNISNIEAIDIWNYLIENKWKKSHNLMISDIVSDIINFDLDLIK